MTISKETIVHFLKTEFPQSKCRVEAVGKSFSTVSREINFDELRPGGTVSGPTMMCVADVAIYVALLGTLGIVPMAATSSLNINFLRKPSSQARIIGECQLIKSGRILVVGEVSLFSEGSTEPVAHAVGTYALPPSVSDT